MVKNIVIVYDIADDKRRLRVFKLLKDYATRIQFSVFEGNLTDEQIVKLEFKLLKLINSKEDSIAFINLCKNCKDGMRRFGAIPEATGDRDIIV